MKYWGISILLAIFVVFLAAPVSAGLGPPNHMLWYSFMTPTDFYLFPVHAWLDHDNPKVALEALIEGISQDPLGSPVPSNVRVLGVTVEDGLATVDLSSEILQAPVGAATEAIMIGAMVNTLTTSPSIQRVQFMVEGEVVESLGGHISAEEPFEPSLNQMYEGFPDMAGHWAEGQVNAFVLRGIIEGYPDGTFKPQWQITREEFIKLVVASLHLEGLQRGTPSFSDVPVSRWSSPYVERAVQEGLIRPGDYGTTLEPANPIPRKEMAVILARAAGLSEPAEDTAGRYPDLGGLTGLETDSVLACTDAGLLEGYEDGTFRPNGYLTRAEASTVMVRLTGMGGPDIFVAFPGRGQSFDASEPLLVIGTARTFEGNVLIQLLDGETELDTTFVTATEGMGWGFFAALVPWPEGQAPVEPKIRVFWESPQDGRDLSSVLIPLTVQ